ncbi:hypothetical protein ACLSU7_10870 [Bdellovibrio sp. HCB185ZH]|uniref:hypothetical protein n=1 Tax=Bdellovibrio sp. HCB185ZH TaxID=3394235 RepID=UPI0039A4C243
MSQYDDKTKWMILITLFITSPILAVVDCFIIYSFLVGEIKVGEQPIKAKMGFIFLLVIGPGIVYSFYKIAKENSWLGK